MRCSAIAASTTGASSGSVAVMAASRREKWRRGRSASAWVRSAVPLSEDALGGLSRSKWSGARRGLRGERGGGPGEPWGRRGGGNAAWGSRPAGGGPHGAVGVLVVVAPAAERRHRPAWV